MLHAGDELSGALAAPVVDPVVTVRGGSQLAEPPEDDTNWGLDVDRAKERLIDLRELPVTRVFLPSLLRRRSPHIGDGWDSRRRRYSAHGARILRTNCSGLNDAAQPPLPLTHRPPADDKLGQRHRREQLVEVQPA